MALTNDQKTKISIARKQVGDRLLDDPSWRMWLHNTVHMTSLRDGRWTQANFEAVMAGLEDLGFRDRDRDGNYRDGDYWRRKASGLFASERAVAFIHGLAKGSRYELGAMCRKFSGGRTEFPEKLRPGEAWKLTEMLKQSNARGLPVPPTKTGDSFNAAPTGRASQSALFDMTPPPKPKPVPAAVPVEVMEDEPPF